jgi:hypothetical protein
MNEQTLISPRVLVVVFNPLIDPVRRVGLQAHMGWNRVEDLIGGYIRDVSECSGGLVQYRVVDRREVAEFPVKIDGFRYTPQSYLDVITHRSSAHAPDDVDYHRIVEEFNVLERVENNELDEVWLFGYPYAGFYESRMAGSGAFWCNAPPLENTQRCSRRFVIMGFNYERGVGEMLEDLGHRTESILEAVYAGKTGERNLWQRFCRYDRAAPGKAEVGNVHFAPNSLRDYDWGNRRFVFSRCDDWLNYPHLEGKARRVNCKEWGNGDTRLHHRWWLSHLPRASGSTDGIANNWWRYVLLLLNGDEPEVIL